MALGGGRVTVVSSPNSPCSTGLIVVEAPGAVAVVKTPNSTWENPELIQVKVLRAQDKGKITGRAVAAMHSQTDMQMAQIYDQMKLLADQAKKIQSRIEVSERIYQASISFEPLINHRYFLYQKEEGTDFMSMIGPEEWGRKKNWANFVAEIKLLADHTWEIIREAS